MLYQNRLIDLLDRKFNLVDRFSSGEFLLELENFVHFIQVDEILSMYANYLIAQYERKEQEFNQDRERLLEQLVQIGQELEALFPDFDDNEEVVNPFNHVFNTTARKFDQIVNDVKQNIEKGIHIESNDAVFRVLIGRLQQKLEHQQLSQEIYDSLVLKLLHIQDADVYLRRKVDIYRYTSPEASLINLYKVASKLNPVPQQHGTPSSMVNKVVQDFSSGETALQQELRGIIYAGKENRELIERCKASLHRAYEGIRAVIGSHLIHYEILQRYQARCTWYDRQRLEKLIEENSGKEEDALTRDLALYLFDNGISTLYRVRRGAHEYDLIGYQTESPIFVEVKIHKSSNNARSSLIQGLAQLHSYLNSLEAENLFIEEVYYIIYRLGGPIYDIPKEIPTSRRIFYSFTVDLGPSKTSGRRQPKPILITLNDFFEEINKEV